WIRQAITRAITEQGPTIRLPVYVVEVIHKLNRTSQHLVQELGREPTIDEIAKEMRIPPEKVLHLSKLSLKPVSLETPIGNDEESSLEDIIEDKTARSPEVAAMNADLSEQTQKALSGLTSREEKVLKLRFGLGEKYDVNLTLDEVSENFGLTRERIRQIEVLALKKLKDSSGWNPLKDFVEE
ncbi:MAG: sigma-70 family RNA polymerase sigma factor, partial [Deltaproteobacteria bacterium]